MIHAHASWKGIPKLRQKMRAVESSGEGCKNRATKPTFMVPTIGLKEGKRKRSWAMQPRDASMATRPAKIRQEKRYSVGELSSGNERDQGIEKGGKGDVDDALRGAEVATVLDLRLAEETDIKGTRKAQGIKADIA